MDREGCQTFWSQSWRSSTFRNASRVNGTATGARCWSMALLLQSVIPRPVVHVPYATISLQVSSCLNDYRIYWQPSSVPTTDPSVYTHFNVGFHCEMLVLVDAVAPVRSSIDAGSSRTMRKAVILRRCPPFMWPVVPGQAPGTCLARFPCLAKHAKAGRSVVLVCILCSRNNSPSISIFDALAFVSLEAM